MTDESLGPFGPSNKRFPMPGMIGPSSSLKPVIQKVDFVPQVSITYYWL